MFNVNYYINKAVFNVGELLYIEYVKLSIVAYRLIVHHDSFKDLMIGGAKI